ncbi:hypothetical protein L7F22_040177 [Adiantum nelumboides]|nr:hypothetical protein [Adiantum nelumboides]
MFVVKGIPAQKRPSCDGREVLEEEGPWVCWNLHSLKEKNVVTEETHNEEEEEDREQQYPRRSDGECPSEFEEDEDERARKVIYWLSVSVQDTMIGHIQDATSPKQAWDKLVSVDTTNTKTRKIQLKNELNTVKKENLSISDYTLKIKGIVESLASIGVQVEDDDKVEVCLCGLTPTYKQFKTSIQTRENIPCFSDLVHMLVVEEKNLGENASSSQGRNNSEQVFYSNRGRGRGRGAGQGRGHGRGNQNQGQQQYQSNDAQW